MADDEGQMPFVKQLAAGGKLGTLRHFLKTLQLFCISVGHVPHFKLCE